MRDSSEIHRKEGRKGKHKTPPLPYGIITPQARRGGRITPIWGSQRRNHRSEQTLKEAKCLNE